MYIMYVLIFTIKIYNFYYVYLFITYFYTYYHGTYLFVIYIYFFIITMLATTRLTKKFDIMSREESVFKKRESAKMDEQKQDTIDIDTFL